MGNATMAILFFCLCFFLPSLAETGGIPALYVFVDVVNINNQNTSVKANFLPYGIDFPQKATGRFTNGYTMLDFFGEFLDLPFSRAYMNCNLRVEKIRTGFNYASASSGILEYTRDGNRWELNMKKQVELFTTTVAEYLPLYCKGKYNLSSYSLESIFIVHTRSSDYIGYYIGPNTKAIYNPEQFHSACEATRKSIADRFGILLSGMQAGAASNC